MNNMACSALTRRYPASRWIVELDEKREAGRMVDMIPIEHRHKYRRIENPFMCFCGFCRDW
jgi:hypothetical protein